MKTTGDSDTTSRTQQTVFMCKTLLKYPGRDTQNTWCAPIHSTSPQQISTHEVVQPHFSDFFHARLELGIHMFISPSRGSPVPCGAPQGGEDHEASVARRADPVRHSGESQGPWISRIHRNSIVMAQGTVV